MLECLKVIDFFMFYVVISFIIGVFKSMVIKDYVDFNGKCIGVICVMFNDMLIMQNVKGVEIMCYEDDVIFIILMVIGQVEVFFSMFFNLQEMQKKVLGKNLEMKFEQKVFDLGIVINKNQLCLKEWIDNWVKINQKNGKFNVIYKKYYGCDLLVVVQNFV